MEATSLFSTNKLEIVCIIYYHNCYFASYHQINFPGLDYASRSLFVCVWEHKKVIKLQFQINLDYIN